MRNIALIDYDITVMGGVQRVTEKISNYFSKKYKVYIISLNKENDTVPYKFDEKIDVIFSTTNKDKRLRTSTMRNFGKVSKILKDKKIDVALCMGHYATFVAAVNKIRAKTKLIYCDHGAYVNSIDDKLMCFIRKMNYRLTSHTVLLTKRNYDDYIKYVRAKKSRLSYIYNCISEDDIKKYSKIEYNKSSKELITISRLSSEKGIDLLLAVATELRRIYSKEWQWHIFGDGNMKQQIQEQIRKLDLSSNVILKGEDKNAKSYLKNYGIYCLTSYHEGLPIVLLEAKVNKLPIISFDVTTGPSEIVKNNVNGFLIDCYDTKKMAEKIKFLLENDSIRLEFSANTKVDLDKFDENTIMNEWDNLINRIKEK